MHCFNTEFELFYWIVHRRFFVFAGKKGVSRVLEGKYKYPNTKQFLTETSRRQKHKVTSNMALRTLVRISCNAVSCW